MSSVICSQGDLIASTIRRTPSAVRPEAPVVLQAQHHAALLGPGQQLLDRPDDPAERLLVGVALQGRLDPLLRHEVVERLDRAPAAGVDPHGGDAQPVGQVDLVERLLDVGAPQVRVGADEPLVGREAHQRQAERMGPALDLLEGGVGLVLHLDVEDLDAVEAHGGGLVDAGLDAEPLAPELPERVGRDADRVAAGRAPWGRVLPVGGSVLARGRPGQPDRRAPGRRVAPRNSLRFGPIARLLDMTIVRPLGPRPRTCTLALAIVPDSDPSRISPGAVIISLSPWSRHPRDAGRGIGPGRSSARLVRASIRDREHRYIANDR